MAALCPLGRLPGGCCRLNGIRTPPLTVMKIVKNCFENLRMERVPGDSTDAGLGSLNGRGWNGKGGARIPFSRQQPPGNRPNGHRAANPFLIYLSSIPPLSIESPWVWLGGSADSGSTGAAAQQVTKSAPLSFYIYNYIYYKSKSPWATAFGGSPPQ